MQHKNSLPSLLMPKSFIVLLKSVKFQSSFTDNRSSFKVGRIRNNLATCLQMLTMITILVISIVYLIGKREQFTCIKPSSIYPYTNNPSHGNDLIFGIF